MDHVRISVRPTDGPLPPAADVYGDAEFVERAEGLQWNVSGDPTTLMAHVVGDRDRIDDALDAHPAVHEYDFTVVDDGEYYVFTRSDRTEVADAMFDAYTQSGLIVVPPVEYDEEGMHLQVLGTPAELRSTFEYAPDLFSVTVEAVGEYSDPRESILGALSDRQREAVETGLDVGYYDVPREAPHEAVADRLECAPSTASEHLRKAESKIIRGVLEGVGEP